MNSNNVQMLINKGQIRRMHQLLHRLGEMAWKQDYIAEASRGRVYHTNEMSVDEASIVISMLEQVESGTRAAFNPRPLIPAVKQTTDPESEAEKCQRLRRKILSYCHSLEWYKRNPETGQLMYDQRNRPILDFARIDAYCLKYSRAHKTLNQHTSEELTGRGGLVFQFQIMANNHTNSGQKTR